MKTTVILSSACLRFLLLIAFVGFAGATAKQKGKSGKAGSFEDVNDDGVTDLVMHFPTESLELTQEDAEGVLIGKLAHGTPIRGVDALCVVPAQGLAQASTGSALIAAMPTEFALEQNYPNPFNPETEIHFQIPQASHVVVRIFNTLGQEIRTLVNAQYDAGFHSVRWDSMDNHGNPVSSGIYFYQLQAGTFSQMKKMTFLQ